jgi:hypothetical protein
MRTRSGETGRILLCVALLGIVVTARGQALGDARSAAREASPRSTAQHSAPVTPAKDAMRQLSPLTAYNPAPVEAASSAVMSPTASARERATSIYPGRGVQPATGRVAPSNDDCANAIPIFLSPGVSWVDSGDNTGATEDCPALSGGVYAETWYELHVPTWADVSIQYCGTSPAFYNAYIVMDRTCPCSGEWIFAHDWSQATLCTDGNWTLNWSGLAAGTYYWPLLCDPANGASGPYTVTFVCPEPPCWVPCQPSDVPEPEECGQDTDGGCNATPAVFAPLRAGETICGTLWANTSARDTDWYQLTTTEPLNFTWMVHAESSVLIFIIQGAGPEDCSAYGILCSASGGGCDWVSLNSGPQPAGTYWFWVGSSSFTSRPCPLEYRARLECSVPPPCEPDFVVEGPYPYTTTGSTCGAGNDCDLRPSEDVIYEVTLPESGLWTFSLCGSSYDTYLFIGSQCCLDDIASNDDYCDLQSQITINHLPAGTYWVTIEGYSDCGDYRLLIDSPPCRYGCPPDATQEPEPCGDDQDGGCNITPAMFAPIHCGETVCGTSWANTSLCDTDWYQYVTTTATAFEWRVTAEFPVLIFIIRGAGPDDCSSYTILASATGPGCEGISLNSGPQPAGAYWFWIGSSSFDNLPCPLSYVATLTGTPVLGACCEPAAPWCEVLTSEDCVALGGTWLGIGTECDPTDCNGNGIPDKCELALGWQRDCNHNGILDVCDIASGHSCDCQGDGVPDECEMYKKMVDLPRDILALDDGSSENNWGLTAGGELCWINHYTCGDGGFVDTVLLCFGCPSYPGNPGVEPGDRIRIYIWNDPNGDGHPADAVLAGEGTGTVSVSSIDSDELQSVPFSMSVTPTRSFFVGASVVTSSGYPAAADDDGWHGAPNQSFLTFNGIPFDPTNITANLYAMGDLGYPQTVFILRAEAICCSKRCGPSNDCNVNGIPDECDIDVQFGGDCTRPGVACWPLGCDTDWNHNGTPDHCEICGDMNGDGVIDIDDYWIFVGAFGACEGDIKYVPLADFDGDACITLADFRAWRMCYKMYNGVDFVAPKWTPTPAAAPARHALQ